MREHSRDPSPCNFRHFNLNDRLAPVAFTPYAPVAYMMALGNTYDLQEPPRDLSIRIREQQ